VFCRQCGIDKVKDGEAGLEMTLPFFSFLASAPFHHKLDIWDEKFPSAPIESKKFSQFLPQF
jgi:hypothetical protein